MYRSNLLLVTHKETPAEAEVVSHQLMLRAGMISQLSSGSYTWLPLGLRVLQKVKAIVRQEMNRAGCQEITTPSIQPAELWQATKRWDIYGDELLKMQDRRKRYFCYAPTAEEVVTETLRPLLHSYKQLPLTVYQITTKFRDEIRPRFGVLRAREFTMKDAYSFHTDQACWQKTYQTMFDVYCQILNKLSLNFRPVAADGGNISKGTSHEFQILADTGEDEILYNDEGTYAANIEVAEKSNLNAGDPSPDGHGVLKSTRGIEVGHIFQLGNRYSTELNTVVTNKEGKEIQPYMGCYGLGISRLVGAAIEQCHDKKGIIFPAAMAPFQLALIPIDYHQSSNVKQITKDLYTQLTEAGIEILLYDRQERPGVMFSEADLIGIPHRLVISNRSLENNSIEYKARTNNNSKYINKDEIQNFLMTQLKRRG